MERGGGGAHVTHVAYFVTGTNDNNARNGNNNDGLANIKSEIERKSTTGCRATSSHPRNADERAGGFWGVWEPVLAEGGGGGKGGRENGGRAGNVPGWTALSRRGGAFRLVPVSRQQ